MKGDHMPYTTTKEMLSDAYSKGYAVVGFSVYTLETVKELVHTANRLRAPLIIQTTPKTIDSFGIEYLTSIVRIAANSVDTPVALHLDHGNSFDLAMKCLEHGYTSIMIDGSHLPFQENIDLVRKVVERAHKSGVPVEAELGRIGGVEDELRVDEEDAGYTAPDSALEFVEKTGIDSLAISIGTAHGMYHRPPKLNFELLKTIRSMVNIPLVLHGASGIPDQDLQRSVHNGISKINIATELKWEFATALRTYMANHPKENDPRNYLAPALSAYSKVVEHKILLANARNRF